LQVRLVYPRRLCTPIHTPHASKGKRFELENKERKAILEMKIMMSYHDLPEIHDYFSNEPDLRVQPITETMPRDRFYSIRRGLYFANNHDAPDKKGPNTQQSLETSSTDQTFQCCFPKCHGFNFEHEIDQGMTKSKGNHVLKQYMKQIPIQRGFKHWCCNYSKTGCLCQLDIYVGKKTAALELGS